MHKSVLREVLRYTFKKPVNIAIFVVGVIILPALILLYGALNIYSLRQQVFIANSHFVVYDLDMDIPLDFMKEDSINVLQIRNILAFYIDRLSSENTTAYYDIITNKLTGLMINEGNHSADYTFYELLELYGATFYFDEHVFYRTGGFNANAIYVAFGVVGFALSVIIAVLFMMLLRKKMLAVRLT
ncbi:MAG: hypothetical protein FWF81_08275 [Defluviitaleaceae bacterium]|nr:hypothetical protein [Defluviitaleaceae bacterium]